MSVPTKGNTTTNNSTPGGSFRNQAHNQNTGSGGLIVAQFTMSNSVSYSSATYGGVAMTQLYQINRSGLGQRMAFFYLENPPTGSNTLRVNFNNSQWNPLSTHIRSFTNSGGIGNSLRSGGSSTPHNASLTVSDDSFIMMTSCSINAITSQQIPTGTNQSYTQHNTNRQVGTGAISSNAGHSAGSIALRATSTFGNISLDRTEILGIGATPTLTVSTTALSGFTYVEGSGPSNEVTFTVSGEDLTANATVSAPSDYEVSLTSGNSFASSVSLTQSSGDIVGEPKTVYVRLKSGLPIDTYTIGNVTVASAGAITKNLSVNGNVTEPLIRRIIIV
tara:strand:+ start:775 stop:1773 length:999 start_codon:yes stop_codon:yes gene_type:complete